MEGRGKQLPLPDGDDPTGAQVGSQNADARTSLLYPRCPDEDRAERAFYYAPGQRDVALEGVDLAAERVPADGHVDAAVGLLAFDAVGQPVRQHDHPGAGTERGQALADELAQRLEDVEGDGEPPQRRRLTTGDHQAVHAVEFLRAADRRRPRPGGLERTQVLGHVALQGEHADDGLHASSGYGT